MNIVIFEDKNFNNLGRLLASFLEAIIIDINEEQVFFLYFSFITFLYPSKIQIIKKQYANKMR